MRFDLIVNYLAFKNRLYVWCQRCMSKKDDEELANAIGWGAILLGGAWLLSKLIQNKPITRCPNCHLVVKDNLPQCPRCGVYLQWKR